MTNKHSLIIKHRYNKDNIKCIPKTAYSINTDIELNWSENNKDSLAYKLNNIPNVTDNTEIIKL